MSQKLMPREEKSENLLIIPSRSSNDIVDVVRSTDGCVEEATENIVAFSTSERIPSKIQLRSLFGALYMENDKPPKVLVEVNERSVERIRQKIKHLDNNEDILFDIDISYLGRLDTPEGYTRLSVILLQLATIQKKRTIINIGKAANVDSVKDPLLYRNTLRILKEAAEHGFSFVRIPSSMQLEDIQGIWAISKDKGVDVILTSEVMGNDKWTPPENEKINYCSYYELVVKVENEKDLGRIFNISDIVNLFLKENKLIIRVNGLFSRVLNLLTPSLGSSMMKYDVFSEKEEKDQGSIERMTSLMNEMGLSQESVNSKWSISKSRISDRTRINFIFGKISSTRRSVVMFNAEAKRKMEDAIFIPFESDYNDLSSCMDIMRNASSNGALIDIPYKSLAVKVVDEISALSKKVGSINLVKKDENGKLIGHNTEGQAVVDLLGRTNAEKCSRVLVMGSGATGRSAAAFLHTAGYMVLMLNTGNPKLELFLKKLGAGAGTISLENVRKLKGKIDIVINATPDGMIRDPKDPKNRLMVSDIVRVIEPRVGMELSYRENWTPFLSSVESRGGLTISGIDFLLKKKELSYDILMGYKPDINFLREVTREAGYL